MINFNDNELNELGPLPTSEIDALLGQMQETLSGGGSSGDEPVHVNLQLLADLRRAISKLQDQLIAEPTTEVDDPVSKLARLQEDSLGSVFDSLPTPLAILDPGGQVERANPALVTAFGFDPTGLSQAEVIEKISLSLPDGSPVQITSSGASRALMGEKVSGERQRFTSLSGESFEAIVSATPLLTGDQIRGVVLLWHPASYFRSDVSGSPTRDAQETKNGSIDCEAILEAIIDHLPLGLIITDAREGKVLLASKKGKSLLAPAFTELEGASWHELLAGWQGVRPDGVAPVEQADLPPSRILHSGEVIHEEQWIFQGIEGEQTSIVISGGPVRDDEGGVVGGVLTWQDVSEQKSSVARLRESEARERAHAAELQAVLDAVPATVWIAKDPECREVIGNRYSYEMLRMPYGVNQSKTAPEGEAPVHFRVYQDGVEVAPHELPLQVSAAQGIEIRDFEEQIVFEDGVVRSVVGNVTPLLDEEGRSRGAIAAFVDITPRVQAEHDLRDSENRFRTLFETMVESFTLQELIYDEAGKPVDFRILEANPAFERLTGLRRDQIIGRTRNELTSGPAPKFIDRVARAVLTGAPQRFEFYSEALQKDLEISAYRTGENQVAILTMDITERKQAVEALHKAHVELEDRVKERTQDLVESNRLLSETNELLSREIIDRQRAEAALRDSKTLFERLIQLAPDPILRLDDRYRILDMNFQAVSGLGYNIGELLGEPFKKLLPEYLHSPFASWQETLDETDHPHSMLLDLDLYVQRSDGERFPVDIKFNWFQIEGKQQAICLIHDITPRKQIEDALRESEARFRALFEQSPVGIQLLDLEGNNLEWNPRFQEMVGFDAYELRKMTYLDYTYPADIERNKTLFDDLVNGKIDHYSIEKRFQQKDGQVVWRRLYVSLARDIEGLPLFIVKIVEDIDERKRIEAELAEVQRRLIDSNETERILIARELHDGPLQEIFALNYNLSALNASLDEVEHKVELSSIQTRLIEINQVLRSIMRELRPPALSPFGLEKAILDHADQFVQRYPNLDIRFELMPDGSRLPERVRLALFRIYQVALSNVTRHAQASEVVVRLVLTEEDVTLEIQDNGIGFEVPERWIGLVRQGQYGLVGAAERAEAIGGRLQISSRPGEGALLRVVVPRGIDL